VTVDPTILARTFAYQDPCSCGTQYLTMNTMCLSDEMVDVIICERCRDFWEVDADLPRCWCGGLATYRQDATGGVLKCQKCGMIRKLTMENP
jgi:hypothetical protein